MFIIIPTYAQINSVKLILKLELGVLLILILSCGFVIVLWVYLMCICCTVNVLFFFLLQMTDCWLEVSIRKVLRPATSTQVFLGFPVPKSKC